MSWQIRPLSEIADFVLGKMLDQAKNRGEPLPYLANVNVRWGDFDLSDLREMRFEPHEVERYGLKPGDIVMCEGGEPGRCALWKGQRESMMIQKALHRIRPRANLDSTFLYYAFLNIGKQNGFAPYFTGATIKHLPREQLARVPIRFPEWSEQKAIAVVLSAYDDLIATNQRRIALLEDAARRLYREWFVHLRFPGHESVPVKDGVPEGWAVRNLFDVCDVDYGFPFKANQFNSDCIGMPAIRIRDIPDVTTSTYTAEEVDSSYVVRRGDFLIGMDGIFHMNFWVGEDALLVQRVCRIRPKNDLHRAFFGLALHAPIKAFEATIQGATVAHLGAKHLKSIELLIPAALDEQLNYLNQSLWQQIQLREVNRKLTQARDLLLPKLMSGQLDVSGIPLPAEVAA